MSQPGFSQLLPATADVHFETPGTIRSGAGGDLIVDVSGVVPLWTWVSGSLGSNASQAGGSIVECHLMTGFIIRSHQQ